MHLLITRPEPDAAEWAGLLRARGLAITIDPLLEITLNPPTRPLPASQALVATSRNALRALAQSPADVRADAIARPVFTVGPGTSALARDLGFTAIHEGPASARELVPIIVKLSQRDAGPLLQLSGDKLAYDLAGALQPHGLMLERQTVYVSTPATAFRPDTRDALSASIIDAVALMSPLTAQTFLRLAQETGLTERCQRLIYICLSNKVAGVLSPLSPRTVHIAAEPNSEAVFTLIETLLA